MNWVDLLLKDGIPLLVSFVIFVVLLYAGKYIHGKIKSHSRFKNSKFLNLAEYLPEEEFTTIRQVFYLVMIVIFVINMLNILFGWRDNSRILMLLDIIVSLYVVINGDISFSKNKLWFILIIPFCSLSYLIFQNPLIAFLDLIHVFAFFYLIKVYYGKFVEYTETNSLGITILLLFSIVFVSFFITMIVEGVSPIDSIVMVSNAFTSNGYSVLGNSTVGKINAILLVWSGFILSGVGTATLAVAIVMKYANQRFDRLENLVKKNKKE